MAAIRRHGKGFMLDARIGRRRHRQVFRSRAAAEDALARWESEGPPRPAASTVAQLPQGRARRDTGPTIGELLDAWRAHKIANTTKPRHAREVVRRLQSHFRRSIPASQLTARDVDKAIAACRERGCSPATINHLLCALRAALRWASDPDRGAMLEKMPVKVKLIPAPRINGATVRRHLISEAELERLLDVCQPQLRAIFALCAFAGLRRDEALHLQVRDVDLDAGIVAVRDKPEVNWTPKTHQSRDVEMGPRLRAEMVTWLKEREASSPGDWLFVSQRTQVPYIRRGDRLRQIAPQVKRAYKRAGITVPKGGCHTLRKLWATRAGATGDYEALREMGGWSSWEAMRHYVSAGAERRRRIAEQF